MTIRNNYYEILQVETTATPEDIKKSYRQLVLKYHPDNGGDSEQFTQIQAAYDILSDLEKKQQYDASLAKVGNQISIDVTHSVGETNPLSNFADVMHSAFIGTMRNHSSNFTIDNYLPEWDKPKVDGKIIFYMAGNRIPIKEILQKSLFPLIGQRYQFRAEISAEEIKRSYPTEGSMILFFKLHDAVQYSRATRIGDINKNDACYQGCIFTVKCLVSLNQDLINSGTIYINEDKDKSMERVYFIKVDIKELVPLQGQLIIQRSVFVDNSYPLVNFEEINEFTLSSSNKRSDAELFSDAMDQCRLA